MNDYVEELAKGLDMPKWAAWVFVGAVAVIMVLEKVGFPEIEGWEEK